MTFSFSLILFFLVALHSITLGNLILQQDIAYGRTYYTHKNAPIFYH